jgi:hypothetical protein
MMPSIMDLLFDQKMILPLINYIEAMGRFSEQYKHQ